MAKAAPILALLAGNTALIGFLGSQLGFLAPMTGFTLFAAGALLGGLLTVIVSLVALFLSRGGRNPDGKRLGLGALAVGCGLLLIVAVSASPGNGLPPINDITTDLESPPEFASATIMPGYEGRDMGYPDEFREQVREAYPDLKPFETKAQPEQVFAAARQVALDLGWKITAESPAQTIFDAEHETSLFRFVDDVSVRIVHHYGGSKVDVRSKSRDGRGDLGANAKRIRGFLDELEAAL